MDDCTQAERFGRHVADALGTGPNRMTINAQRARLASEANRLAARSIRERLSTWALAGSAVVAVAAVLVVVQVGLRGEASMQAEFAGRRVQEHSAVTASASRAESLAFSDGSTVVLKPNARAKLSRLEHARTELKLDQGAIVADIRKQTGTTWTIAVGPYSVRVVGTRFSVAWDPDTKRLHVAVEEGRVRVFGGDLKGDGIALNAGARLERQYPARAPVRPESREHEPSPSAATISQPETATEPHSVSKTRSSGTQSGPVGTPSGSGQDPAAPSWQALAGKGSYREALSIAVAQGFEKLSSTLPENDLIVLANTARYSGDASRARDALLKLRQRFPGRSGATLAALYLARVSEDLERRPSEAARWLRVFLQESPRSDLAESARVNLMSILLRSGDQSGARAVAEDYLKYHPNGAHRGQARSLLGQ